MRKPFARHQSLWAYLWRGIKISVLLIVLFWLYCLWQVWHYAERTLPADYHADVAVVLGAAAWDVRPSPVFRERLNHAIALYQADKVEYLAFTGGTPKAGFMSEADVGKRFALKQGVRRADIVLENTSRNTYENLLNIQPILREQGWKKIVIVSDPYHLARTAAMAKDLGLNADFSGTPTSLYQQGWKKWQFVLQESVQLFAYHGWKLVRFVF
ncbi:MAG: YdcF family protein [Neisseria sp.]|nr:YdcF family protein [Neisseria sp.]